MLTGSEAPTVIFSGLSNDVWASFNGGKKWSQCRLQAGQTVTENSPAVALTADESLVVGSGFPHTDLWISDMSLADPTRLRSLCGGTIPDEGVGLWMEDWEPWYPEGNGTDYWALLLHPAVG